MNSREFYDLVCVMRDKQREYFSSRDKNVLNDCKALEAQVDGEIARVNKILELKEKAQAAVNYIDS